MKKLFFAVKLVVFVAIFVVLLVFASYIVRPQSDMKTRFTGFYAEPKDSIDVIVIGSSPVAPLYAAPLIWNEFGITLYPLGTNSQPTVGIKYLVKEAQKRQGSSLFVIDVSLFMVEPQSLLTEPNIRNIVDNMTYSLNRIGAINEMVQIPGERINYYFDISKYHSVLRDGELSAASFKDFDFAVPSVYKGYFFVDAVEPFDPVDVSGITETKPIPDESEQILLDLMAYCESEQLDVMFVIAPYITSDERKMSHNYLQALIESHGYTFIDFNDKAGEFGIDYSTDLYNRNHLNLSGAEKFSMYFGAYLADTYDFADNRGSADYTSWDDAYAAWETQAAIAREKIAENAERLSNISR
ncbi:MAG: hypothetical protein HN948_00470 [Clostridia bacterium]|nr:hypothetical protein [Clostridia bacterium]MBT7121461.1 hypothetical protein [Clostridia bacterium]